MGKSSRSSSIKKNNQVLKKKVFGPVETARIERQNAKLLELAKAPKDLVMEDNKPEDTPAEKENDTAVAKDIEMEVDDAKPQRSKREVARLQEARKVRQVSKLRGSRSRPRNQKEFPAHKLKKKASKR